MKNKLQFAGKNEQNEDLFLGSREDWDDDDREDDDFSEQAEINKKVYLEENLI